jgi:hypothetical protein
MGSIPAQREATLAALDAGGINMSSTTSSDAGHHALTAQTTIPE